MKSLTIMDRKTIIYISFVIACVAVTAVFLTSTSYLQLGIAILLYPLLPFFAYRIFPLKDRAPKQVHQPREESQAVSDTDKRTFLKMVGATGLSFFLISVFGQRIEYLLFGQKMPQIQMPPNSQNLAQNNTDVAPPTLGYNISEIDDSAISYYGFTNNQGSWYIMRDDDQTGNFRYAKGQSNFSANWQNRQALKYDYYYQVF